MITVRPFDKKDFRYVQDICLNEYCDKSKQNPTNRALICSEHCDYYLDCESEFCFVAVDEQNVPTGYIFCAVDLDNYFDKMSEEYLPLVRKISGTEFFHRSAELKLEQKYCRQGYTAHLHFSVAGMLGDGEAIDAEDEAADSAKEENNSDGFREESVGALFDVMLGKLKESFVEGVYVMCDSHDETARRFYEKYGFDDIDYLNGAVVYAKKLFDEE